MRIFSEDNVKIYLYAAGTLHKALLASVLLN